MTRVEHLAEMTLIDENIARGTTDPWVDTITGGTLQLANLVNRWCHMHLFEI